MLAIAAAYATRLVLEPEWQGFWPCVDPSEAVIPQSPYECFRKGEQARGETHVILAIACDCLGLF